MRLRLDRSNVIGHGAAEEGYVFRVPANTPRDPKNTPMGDGENILTGLQAEKLPEYFAVNKDAQEMIYAQPIALTPFNR